MKLTIQKLIDDQEARILRLSPNDPTLPEEERLLERMRNLVERGAQLFPDKKDDPTH